MRNTKLITNLGSQFFLISLEYKWLRVEISSFFLREFKIDAINNLILNSLTEQRRRSYRVPPVARSLMCSAVIPRSLHFSATSWAANIAAYGDASSLSAFTFIPPVMRTIVSLQIKKRNLVYQKTSKARYSKRSYY